MNHKKIVFNLEKTNILGLDDGLSLIDLAIVGYIVKGIIMASCEPHNIPLSQNGQAAFNIRFDELLRKNLFLGFSDTDTLIGKLKHLQNIGLIDAWDFSSEDAMVSMKGKEGEYAEIFIDKFADVNMENNSSSNKCNTPVSYKDILSYPDNSRNLVANMLLLETVTKDDLNFIENYLITDFKLCEPELLMSFLDIYSGIIKKECDICGLDVEGLDFSVYEPKALRPVRYIIRIIHTCISSVCLCLDKVNGVINDERLRYILIEYIHAYIWQFGKTSTTLQKITSDETRHAFQSAIQEYMPTSELPFYYVYKVLGYEVRR